MTAPLPLPVARSLKRLSANISKARRRREWDQAACAAMMGVYLASLKRLEGGSLGIGLHTFVRALLALQLLDDFDWLFEATNDTIGLIHQDENLSKRVRKSASGRHERVHYASPASRPVAAHPR